MPSLIRQITSVATAGYGVNILESAPPTRVQGVGVNVVAIVGEFPWGPAGVITTVTTRAQLFDLFAPLAFDVLQAYPALKSVLNKTFPNKIKLVRVAATGAVASLQTYDDAGASASVLVTAAHPGAVGDLIQIAWSANADTPANRDATITIGSTYSAFYEDVVVDNTGSITVNDPGDPHVTFAADGGATAVPVVAVAASLAGGSDGAAVAGDYTAAIDVFADVNADWSVLFVAECPAGLISSTNAHLKSFFGTHQRGFGVACTPAGASAVATETAVALARTDRLLWPWPRVKTIDEYDPNRAEIIVDGNAFAAVAIASVAPENSPGGGGGAEYLRGITGLEQGATPLELSALGDAGVAPFLMSTRHEGAIIHLAVTTSLQEGRTRVFRRRMADFLQESMAGFLEVFAELPLDIDLATSSLGPVTNPEIGAIESFLQDLEATSRIKAWSVDPFGGNLQSNIEAGRWYIITKVQLFSMQEQIILNTLIGETVVVDVAA